MVPDLAGTSRLIVLTESALEFPLDLEGDLEGDLERDLDLEFELELEALEALETLSALDARVSERTGTSRVVDHSEAASETALALDVLVVLIDAVDLRLEMLRDGKSTFIRCSDSAADTAETSETSETAELALVLGILSTSKLDSIGVGGISLNWISSKSPLNSSGNREVSSS
ncbi:hypothetical protein BELL_0435g00100 [Botrytis elliptica]|uniref:Uncharacterized protein n=1 Tax=Botrytis elliptica TaxID=278938 RepID=A0A4Z1JFY5_9HELO|nr:hypothetical protein BELL_0435g00100 [Botrytis elliptica]